MSELAARAHRESAVILDELGLGTGMGVVTRDRLISLLALAWLQGMNLGAHESLADAEIAYQKVRAEL